jgi:hypothetical protein
MQETNNLPQTPPLQQTAVRHSILHESFLAAMGLSASDRHCVVSFVRPFTYVDTHTATNICQYTFLNGYYYAAHGAKGLDNEFLQMVKSEFTRITGNKPSEKRNKLQDFIERKSIASDLFKCGMSLYCA